MHRERRVHVVPSGIVFDVEEGQSILQAAEAADVYWPTICHGEAHCTRCFFEIVDGEEHLSPMAKRERDALDDIRWRGTPRPQERLACCTLVSGNVTVRRRGVVQRGDVERPA